MPYYLKIKDAVHGVVNKVFAYLDQRTPAIPLVSGHCGKCKFALSRQSNTLKVSGSYFF
jgi:hypothetical protein